MTTSKLIVPGTKEWEQHLPRRTPLPGWVDVVKAITPDPHAITSMHEPQVSPLAKLNAESFGHQNGKHIGGVPGRHGGCDTKIRFAMYGRNSRQLLSWQGLVIVHDNARELEWLITGDVKCVRVPSSLDPMDTIWIKDHPNFQSVQWPLDEDEFNESRW